MLYVSVLQNICANPLVVYWGDFENFEKLASITLPAEISRAYSVTGMELWVQTTPSKVKKRTETETIFKDSKGTNNT